MTVAYAKHFLLYRPHPLTWFLNEYISSLTLCNYDFWFRRQVSLTSGFIPWTLWYVHLIALCICPLMVQPNKAGKGGNTEVPSIISAPFKKYDMKNCLCVCVCVCVYIYTKFLYNSHLKVAMAFKEVEHKGAFGDDAVPCLDAVLVTWSHTWQNCTHTHTLSLQV